jgi:hypothetical protein
LGLAGGVDGLAGVAGGGGTLMNTSPEGRGRGPGEAWEGEGLRSRRVDLKETIHV